MRRGDHVDDRRKRIKNHDLFAVTTLSSTCKISTGRWSYAFNGDWTLSYAANNSNRKQFFSQPADERQYKDTKIVSSSQGVFQTRIAGKKQYTVSYRDSLICSIIRIITAFRQRVFQK